MLLLQCSSIISLITGTISFEQQIPTTTNTAYEDINKYNKLSIDNNPAYAEIREIKQQHVKYEEIKM